MKYDPTRYALEQEVVYWYHSMLKHEVIGAYYQSKTDAGHFEKACEKLEAYRFDHGLSVDLPLAD